jgi:antitoxin HicB
MRYSVILVPDDTGRVSVTVPALPGCVSMGGTAEEALAHVQEAIRGWLETEAMAGNQPPVETPEIVGGGVVQALETIEEMRQAGEYPPDRGYELEVTTIEIRPPVTA